MPFGATTWTCLAATRQNNHERRNASTFLGVAIGLGGAAALTRLIKSQLHGVNAIDPLTFVVVALGLIAVATFAYWLPARRA
jgi:ABC-type antimicrobial peptide transport system permease subunit